MPIDLNVRVPTSKNLDSFVKTADKLGFAGFATSLQREVPFESLEGGMKLFARADLPESGLRSVKGAVKEARPRSAVIAAPLRGVDIANWAAEDARVDLLTLDKPHNECTLRESTAKLAAVSGTALEVPIEPLLASFGLARSKVVKVFRENVETAMGAGMQVILTSGAKSTMSMRSPTSMRYVGLLLGLDWHYTKIAVYDGPQSIIDRNRKRMSPDFVAPGVEIIHRGEQD
ncbi:MAG: RNase P subunit p30 family protein [Candidatus Thorarchaeota archaeon]|jgi:RNase P/RNase MRP subunit p30